MAAGGDEEGGAAGAPAGRAAADAAAVGAVAAAAHQAGVNWNDMHDQINEELRLMDNMDGKHNLRLTFSTSPYITLFRMKTSFSQ